MTPLDQKYTIHMVGRITLPVPLSIVRSGSNQVPTTRIVVGSTAHEVPTIPGETIKGRLRRIGVDLLVETMTADPAFERFYPGRYSPLTLDDYYYLAVGGVKSGREEDLRGILRTDEMRRANPLISLFGAATPWISGRLVVESATPDEPVRNAELGQDLVDVVRTGERCDDTRRPTEMLGLFAPGQLSRWMTAPQTTRKNARAKGLRHRVPRQSEAARAPNLDEHGDVLQQELDEADPALSKHEKRPVFTRAINRARPGYSVFPKGFSAPHRFSLENATLTELGLFLAILDRFATNPRLGGHMSAGYGRIAAEYTLLVRRPRTSHVEPAGSLVIETDSCSLLYRNRDSDTAKDVIAQARTAWTEATAELLKPDRFDFHQPSFARQ